MFFDFFVTEWSFKIALLNHKKSLNFDFKGANQLLKNNLKILLFEQLKEQR